MEAVVSKWGNSLGLRLTKEISSELNIENGSKVNLKLKKNKIEISLIKSENYTLDAMLASINKNNIHKEISTDPAMGNEVW